MTKKRLVNYLVRQLANQPTTASTRLAAAVFNKKQVISVGYNSYKTHPLCLLYQKNPHAIYQHAEVSAVVQSKLKDLSGLSLLVVRILKDGTLGCSKPCEGCYKLLQDYNLSFLFYFNNNKKLIKEKL